MGTRCVRSSVHRQIFPSTVAGVLTKITESRVNIIWAGQGQPITLTVHGPDGEVAVPLLPKRALELAKELIEPAVQSIKTDQWGKSWPG